MYLKKTVVLAVLAGFLFGALGSPLFAQKPAKTEPKVFIPKEVKTVLETGLLTKQARLDIPFGVVGHLYLPFLQGQGLFENIFSLAIKNGDLGFAPATPAAPPAKEKPAEGQPQPAAAPELLASFNLFIQFRDISGGLPGQVVKEIYVPCAERMAAEGYDAAKTEKYFIVYRLPAGKFLAAMAFTSLDLKKIGTQYFEFSVPDPASFTDRLDTTPIFTAKSIDRMEAPDIRTTLHRGYFTYYNLMIVPNSENIIAPKENLDLFYFIFGVRPNAEQKYSLETNFEVKKGEETFFRFAPTVMDHPLISQPLPMKRTVLKKTDTNEVQEEQDLEPGSYVLVIKILDKVSGISVTKNLSFQVK